MSIKKVFRFQRIDSSSAEHCCVRFCHASSKYNKVMSFHTFPSDMETRRQWIVAIRRENFIVRQHTRVCSRHFQSEDFQEPWTETGIRLLKKGAVPSLFEWNDFSVSAPRAGVQQRDTPPGERTPVDIIRLDHDYAVAPAPGFIDLAVEENDSLNRVIVQLRKRVEELTVKQWFGNRRFAASDEDIRFLTRFASYDHLMRFWALIEPSLPSMLRVSKAQEGNLTGPCPAATSLQPIDEMLLFLNYLAMGSKQQDLAERYGIQKSTVGQIITMWSNFLYTLLGSMKIWIPEEKIKEHLPAEFEDYPDTTVILDCTELRCQCPFSPLQRSEPTSAYKSHFTLKGLLGVAPHGAVTFISRLYAGSISDKQIIRECGIMSLLRPGMAIMVDRGFHVDDFVLYKIYIPGRPQISGCEAMETKAMVGLKVHVERLIRRVKEHKFFDTEIPLWLFGNINQLYTVACLLTNYEN